MDGSNLIIYYHQTLPSNNSVQQQQLVTSHCSHKMHNEFQPTFSTKEKYYHLIYTDKTKTHAFYSITNICQMHKLEHNSRHVVRMETDTNQSIWQSAAPKPILLWGERKGVNKKCTSREEEKNSVGSAFAPLRRGLHPRRQQVYKAPLISCCGRC